LKRSIYNDETNIRRVLDFIGNGSFRFGSVPDYNARRGGGLQPSGSRSGFRADAAVGYRYYAGNKDRIIRRGAGGFNFNKKVKSMHIAKIYGFVWFLAAATAAAAYLSGFSDEITLTIFGFVFSTLVFLGIVAVLPVLMNEHYSPRH
jgi:hypothetical protein